MNRVLASCVIVGSVLLSHCALSAAEAGPAYEHLKVLEPFLGAWEYEGPVQEDIPGIAEKGEQMRVLFRYHWVLNRNAIIMDWSIQLDDGQVDAKVLIGFDPKGGKIVSGEFTSAGEYSHGQWSVEDKTLTITAHGIAADGTPSSTTVTNKLAGRGTMVWQATDRTRGGEPLPDTAEYIFKGPGQQAEGTSSNYEHLKFMDYYRGKWRLEGELPEGKYVGEETNAWAFNKNIQRTAGWGRVGDGQRVDYELLVGWDPAKEKVFMWIAGSDGSSSVREGSYDPDKRCLTSKQRSVDATGAETTAHVEEQRIDGNTFVIKITQVMKGTQPQPDFEIKATRITP